MIYRPSIGPDSLRDALGATFVGDWEEPSGESRLLCRAGLAIGKRWQFRTVGRPGQSAGRDRLPLFVMETTRASWHSVNPVRADTRRCCMSNYFFSAQSPSSSVYYHVTSFLGRPGRPLRRLWGRVDNWLRQTVASTLRISRGKDLINK